jgi:tetratricopeptide (TPR) repeat protein
VTAGHASSPVLARAEALLMAGRAEQALTELAGLPAAEAIGPAAARLRCHALMQLDRWPEVVASARAGLAAGGPDPALLYYLGRGEHESGHLEIAERALLDGLALAPQDVDLLCAYAHLCSAGNQVDKAEKLVERAAALQPHSPVVYAARIQVAYARGDDRAAQRISREFVAAYPENPVAHALFGGTSAARGQVGPAYSGFRQAAAAAPAEADFAESAMELRIAKHPLMLPVRPFLRFGPVKTWIVAVVVIFGLRQAGLTVLAGVAGLAWFLLCVYSWVVPPLVRRWMRRRWR